METRKRNYKSDFDFIFDLGYYDEKGEFVPTGWPPYDFELHFYTGQVLRNYVVKCIGGVATNCFNDNGEVHVVANNHGLGLGVLNVEGVLYLPNDIYPDGSQKIVKPQALDIELVKDAGDDPVSTFRTRLEFPVIKEKGSITSVPSDIVIGDIEPNIVRDALRKTPQVLTHEEQEQVLKNLGNPEFKLFVDMWNEACREYGKYNAQTGFFELNGLTDITYEEAVSIYAAGAIESAESSERYSCTTIRTNLPPNMAYNTSKLNLERFIYLCHNLEVLNLSSVYQKGVLLANPTYLSYIQGARKLRKVIGSIDVHNVQENNSSRVVSECPILEEIFLKNIRCNFNLKNIPKLNLSSVQYAVANAANTSSITIAVHPDVYAKLSDENNTEWNKVLVDAAAKKITFATV